MPKEKLSKIEQETIIRCSAADQEWEICSADPRFVRYIERRGYQPKPDAQFNGEYKFYKIPFRKVRLSSAVSRRTPVSGSQMAILRGQIGKRGLSATNDQGRGGSTPKFD